MSQDLEGPRSECVLAYSSGVVETPEAYNLRTFLPEKRGLCAVEIFGPVPWSAGESRITEEARADRWGHVQLAEAVPHPCAPSVRMAHVPVMPPAYRRYVRLSVEETHGSMREARDRIMAAEDACGDPPSQILGEMGLWSIGNRPLTDAEIAEMPPLMQESPVEGLYRSVVNLSNRLRRMAELDAPEPVMSEARSMLREAVGALFDHIATMDLPDEVRSRALAECVIQG